MNKKVHARIDKIAGDLKQVNEYMDSLIHPFKKEIQALRNIIKSADSKICERIKWNAPSYYLKEDFLTFNLRNTEHIHLIFHHPLIDDISSGILEGGYKGRKMLYYKSFSEIESTSSELLSIIRTIISEIDNK